MELYNSPSIECPPKNLMVDSIFLILRSTNCSKPIREQADAFRVGGARHGGAKTSAYSKPCIIRVAQKLHNRFQTGVFCTKVGQFARS